MTNRGRMRARTVARLLAPQDYRRLLGANFNANEFGYDPFGLEVESALLAFTLLRLVYRHWFRVESSGLENVPREGPVLITPNHSGAIPIDGTMLAVDLASKLEPPRIMRAVVDNFAGFLPFVNTFFYRCGQVIGARKNVTELLEQGQIVALFPEGHRGTGKPFRERYQLQPFSVGFVELSLAYRAPIIPTAIIGAEEQYPLMFNFSPLARLFRVPYFPVTPLWLLGPLGMLPLPTKYRVRYGEPIELYRDFPPETVKDPGIVRQLAEQVRTRVQTLVRQELAGRKGVFGISISSPGKMLATATQALSQARQGARGRVEKDLPASSGPTQGWPIPQEAAVLAPDSGDAVKDWTPVSPLALDGVPSPGPRTLNRALRHITSVLGKMGKTASPRENKLPDGEASPAPRHEPGNTAAVPSTRGAPFARKGTRAFREDPADEG